VFVLVALEVALDAVGEVCVAGFAVALSRVLARPDPQAVLPAVALATVRGSDLRDLEGAEADERAQPDDEVVALARGGSAEVLDLAVGQPDFVFAPGGGFAPHYGCYSFPLKKAL